MNKIKVLFKEHSPYLLGLTFLEIILSIICTLAFVYSDSLTYTESLIFNALGVEKLLQTLYSSTWWALILLLLAFIAIFSLTSIIYKKLEYLFISICSWVVMFVLALNFTKPISDIISVLLLFIPILIINIIAYKTEKNKLTDNTKITKNKQKNKASK